MTTAEVSNRLKVTEDSVARLCRTGQLPGAKRALQRYTRRRKGTTRTYQRLSWAIPLAAVRERLRARRMAAR